MPLPLIPLLLAGGAGLLALTSKKSAPQSPAVSPTPSTVAPTNANQAQGITAGQATGAAGIAAATVAGIVAAVEGGKAIDKAINPNSNEFSQTVGSVVLASSVAVVGTAGILAAIGVLGPLLAVLGITSVVWPVAIFVAAAILIYVLVIVFQDVDRLVKGQAFGRKEWLKQYNDVYQQAWDGIRTNPDNQNKSDVEVERQLVPFTEGFLDRGNWCQYQSIMLKKNVLVDGSLATIKAHKGFPQVWNREGTFPGTKTPITDDLLWHLNWYIDRGYLVGSCIGMRPVGADAPYVFSKNSQSNAFVLQHCPPEEIVTSVDPDVTMYTLPNGQVIPLGNQQIKILQVTEIAAAALAAANDAIKANTPTAATFFQAPAPTTVATPEQVAQVNQIVSQMAVAAPPPPGLLPTMTWNQGYLAILNTFHRPPNATEWAYINGLPK
jgi:hypothetical protein